MASKQQITDAIYGAIDEVNAAQGSENQIAKDSKAILFGQGGKLDSLGLLTFVLQVEQRVQSAGHPSFTLTDEKAMADTATAFRTVESLSDYIVSRLG